MMIEESGSQSSPTHPPTLFPILPELLEPGVEEEGKVGGTVGYVVHGMNYHTFLLLKEYYA